MTCNNNVISALYQTICTYKQAIPIIVGDRQLRCISCIAAPSKPRHFTVTRIFTDGFEVNWIPPQQPNGSVRYELNYGTNTTVFSTVDTASDDTYYNLTGLQQNTTYYIRVVAVNYQTFSGPARTEGEWITANTLEQIETLQSEWCL